MSMRVLVATLVALLTTAGLGRAAEERLVIYTAYEENELKDFWEQFKKDLPDLAAKASYIRGSTGPTMARVEAERANPQADVIWGVLQRLPHRRRQEGPPGASTPPRTRTRSLPGSSTPRTPGRGSRCSRWPSP